MAERPTERAGIFSELNTRPSPAELRSFGLTFLGGAALLGLVFWQLVDHELSRRALCSFIAGAVVLFLSLIPQVGRYLYIAWMGLGLLLGRVTSPILLFIVFLLLFVPVGIVNKLMGRDLMK